MSIEPGVLIVHIIPSSSSLEYLLLVWGVDMAGTVLGMLLESETSSYSGVFTSDVFNADFCRLSKMSSCSLDGSSAN